MLLKSQFFSDYFKKDKFLEQQTNRISNLSQTIGSQEKAKLERLISVQLKKINDPFYRLPFGTLWFIEDIFFDTSHKSIQVKVQLSTGAHPLKHELQNLCQQEIEKTLNSEPTLKLLLPGWSAEVSFRLARHVNTSTGAALTGISSIGQIIAVSSCKGGVGKSTVAVNLACSIAQLGGRVGLLDADIFGPSLPTLLQGADSKILASRTKDKWVLPVEHNGVKCMSFGWVSTAASVPGAGGKGAAVMRGAMVTKVINQLLLATEWGELDYLIIDLPPGTGDIQITISQLVSLSGAIIVTTPHILSLVDVEKGIEMFSKMAVPTLCLVENMSYFECNHGERYYPFGKADIAAFLQILNENQAKEGETPVFQLPLSSQINSSNETGRPIVLHNSSTKEAEVYKDIAVYTVKELEALRHQKSSVPEVVYAKGRGILLRYFLSEEGKELCIPPIEIRKRDSRTGRVLGNAEALDPNVYPVNIQKKGNYAVSIEWSDGFSGSIYSYKMLESLVGG